MPIPKKLRETSHSPSGLHIQPDSDGTNIQVPEKPLAKQCSALGHCFLSLRQFFPETRVDSNPSNMLTDSTASHCEASRRRIVAAIASDPGRHP